MNNAIIFLGGFALSLLVYGLLARFFWWDGLKNQPSGKGDALLLVPHGFRHLGLLVLVPGVVGEPITKTAFAAMLAYGDAVVAPLALIAMWLWLSGSKMAKAVTWLFSILASVDLLNAIYGALTLPAYNFAIGAFWIVLTCVVPLLIVTQIMIFVRLAKG
ncbi:MAG TPA: hypothetical protein VMI47_13375 [Pseudolabrys sp.]|nr:hypothetical protein [Pseudolabrys sp.]